MVGRRILADTSLFIEHLRATVKTRTHLYRLVSECDVETCGIIAAELFYGARHPKAENQALAVLRPFPIQPFTMAMAARTSIIAQALKKINRMQDLRDVMIAATALELELPIATLNRNHSNHIPGLRIKTLPAIKKRIE
ncbi:MAG: type II toxin-antitoxin system VapC family toxin [bacterium]|nr:type II toxin-antitoxin system VapC family toxin [bacterium]